MKIKSLWSLFVALLCLCVSTNLAAKADLVDDSLYTTTDKEFYLTTEQLLFIRPGLVVEIIDVVLPSDMKLEVTYSIKDPAGLPLDHDGITTPGEVDMRFTLANIPMGQEQKVRIAYEDIDADSNRRPTGTLTPLGDGVYTYKFDLALASDLDTTHTLVLGSRRDLGEFDLDRYAANDLYDWVPSGMYDPVPRDVVTTETCNRCHDPLTMHGSRWLTMSSCAQCHNPGLLGDDGMSRSMDVMIHQLHMGPRLETPLVIGRHDYSKMTFPADMSECELCHTGGTPTENFPLVATPNPVQVCDMSGLGTALISWGDVGPFEIRMNAPDGTLFSTGENPRSEATGKWVQDGTVFFLINRDTGETIQKLTVNASVLGCVGNAPGTFRGEPGAQHSNWMDRSSRLVCGSCHDDVDFATGEGHSIYEFEQDDDSECGICHKPDTGREFDVSVKGAHMLVYKSAQLPGVLVEILSISDTDPGDTPTVTFSLGSKNGKLNPADLNRLRFAITGPNEDFDVYIQESVGSNAVASGDNWTYTFATPIPADATGSYTVSVEGRNIVTIDLGPEDSDERDVIENSMLAFAVTDDVAESRRAVVDDYLCENCHSNLSLHGNNRKNADYCTTCHYPAATDVDEVQPGNMEQSIHFKFMVHKIHRGEDLVNGYTVAGHNQSIHPYGEVQYPGDLRNCEACHINGSQQLPLPDGLLATTTPQELYDPMMPVAAACLSCHDNDDATAHAYANTTFFGESCGTCHGEDKNASVDRVHAR